jgi:hypothetical protein
VYHGYHAVAAGPGRLYALALVVAVSVALVWNRPRLDRLLGALAFAFLVRVAFESSLDSYYVWPVLALGLLLAARKGGLRLGVTFGVAVFATWFSNVVWQGVWPWWSIMMLLLVATLALGWFGPDRLVPPGDAVEQSVPATDEVGPEQPEPAEGRVGVLERGG